MDDFFKGIKQEIDSISPIDSSDKAWSRFSNFRVKKAKSERKSRSLMIPLLIGAILTLMTAGLGFTLYSNYKLQETLSHLQTIDTVYITKYIKEGESETRNRNEVTLSKVEYENLQANHESITKLIVSKRYLENRLNRQNQESIRLSNQLEELQLAFTTSIQNEGRSKIQTTEIGPESTTIVSVKERQNISEVSPIDLLKSAPFEIENISLASFLEPIFIANTHKKSLSDLILPKSFSGGIIGGATFKFKDEYANSSGGNIGLAFTSLLNKNLRVRAGIGTFYRKVKVNDSDIIELFPPVTDPLDGRLAYVKLSRNDVFIDAGFDVLLRPFGRFRPFLGAGFGYDFNRTSNFQYKYETTTGELYITREMHQVLRDLYATFTIGSDVNISKNFDGIIKLDYFYGLQNTGSWVNVNTGFMYHF